MMNVRKFLEEVMAKHQERLWTPEEEEGAILRNDGKLLHDDTELHARGPEVSNKNFTLN